MIRWAEDLGAPALVAAADIATTELKPIWNRWVGIGLAAVGYVAGGVLGMGGTFVKNLGIASFPWAAHGIYDMVKEGTAPVSRQVQSARVAQPRVGARVSSYPSQPQNTQQWPSAV